MSLISQAAKRLKTLLATTMGAAQVGFDAGVNYTAGTVGAMIKSLSGQIAGILDGADFTGPVKLPGNAVDNLHAVPLQQAMQIAADAAGLAATGVEVGRLLRVERFTASGTFTKQVGDRLIEAVIVGGGGGGGGTGGGGGGGAGGTAIKILAASALNSNETVTVAGQSSIEGSGATSSFAGVQAMGGTCPSVADANNLSGGIGGGTVGADIGFQGGSGGAGILSGVLTGGLKMFGAGGNSTLGGGAPGKVTTGAYTFDVVTNTGAGGAGGGKGGAGYVELRIYS